MVTVPVTADRVAVLTPDDLEQVRTLELGGREIDDADRMPMQADQDARERGARRQPRAFELPTADLDVDHGGRRADHPVTARRTRRAVRHARVCSASCGDATRAPSPDSQHSNRSMVVSARTVRRAMHHRSSPAWLKAFFTPHAERNPVSRTAVRIAAVE